MDTADCRAVDFFAQLESRVQTNSFELPSFPDVLNRLELELANEDHSLDDVIDVIRQEPVLVAKVLTMANSAAFNSTGREVTDIGLAVSRIGTTLLRSTVVAYAVRQVRDKPWPESIRDDLQRIWRACNFVAAISYSVAKRLASVKKDEAMLAGLMHEIGLLFVLTNAHAEQPELLEHPQFRPLFEARQAELGQRILRAWKFNDRIADAVASQDHPLDLNADDELPPLGRLIAAAKFRNLFAENAQFREDHPDAYDTLASIEIEGHNFLELLSATQQDIDEMQSLLA